MAGHMKVDKIAARRAALIDLLADGRPHPRVEIWAVIAEQLGQDPWGKVPQEALARDMRTLRLGGVRIAYSRRPETAGYYLAYPALSQLEPQKYESINWDLVERVRRLSVPEKNKQAFAAADFALKQKRLILAEEFPDWNTEQIEREARRQVFGVSAEELA
jgi:hypothetical protein